MYVILFDSQGGGLSSSAREDNLLYTQVSVASVFVHPSMYHRKKRVVLGGEASSVHEALLLPYSGASHLDIKGSLRLAYICLGKLHLIQQYS